MTSDMNGFQTFLVSVALFMLFVGRRLIADRIKQKKMTFDGIRDRAMIDRAIDRLDGRFRRPFAEFVPPEEIMDIFAREPGSEYAMNIFLQSVAAHCGYNRRSVMLRAYGPQDNKPPGCITKLGSQFLMELYIDCSEDMNGALAVIIHEFCHFFLDESGLKLEETIENEVLTDTAAIYFGFGKMMRRGYEPRLKRSDKGTDTWYRIGYLDTLNIDYVRQQLERRREFYSQL